MRSLLRFFIVVSLGIGLSAAHAADNKPASQAETRTAKKLLSLTEVDVAVKTLDSLLAAYVQGDSAKFDALTDPRMIGRGVLTDAARQSFEKAKQIRIALSDTKHSTGEDLVIIQTHWIKHFLALPGMTAKQQSGKSTFVMTKSKEGWLLSAVSGDNIFAP